MDRVIFSHTIQPDDAEQATDVLAPALIDLLTKKVETVTIVYGDKCILRIKVWVDDEQERILAIEGITGWLVFNHKYFTIETFMDQLVTFACDQVAVAPDFGTDLPELQVCPSDLTEFDTHAANTLDGYDVVFGKGNGEDIYGFIISNGDNSVNMNCPEFEQGTCQ